MRRTAGRRGFQLLRLILAFGAVAALVALLAGTGARGQTAPTGSSTASGSPAAAAHEPATLVVFNRPIVVFRGELLGHGPAGRVQSARARIEHMLPRTGVPSVGWREVPEGFLITIADRGAFAMVPEDADSTAGETLPDLRDGAVRNLSLALRELQEARTPRLLLRSAVEVVLGTLGALAAGWGLRRVHRRIVGRLDGVVQRLSGRAQPRRFRILSPEQLVAGLQGTARVLHWILVLVVVYVWLTFTLRRFPFTRPWGEALRGYLIAGAKSVLLAVVQALPDLLVVGLIVLVTRFILRILVLFFAAIEAGTLDVPEGVRETARPTRHLLTALIWLLAVVMAYPYLPGSDSDAFKGVSVFVGLMVSLGASGVVGQMLSGLVILYSRALRPGDYVRIGEHEGVVLNVGVLSTKIRTNRREEINIPNALLVSTASKNFTRLARGEGVILHTTVTIGYSEPWRQVHMLLRLAAERTPALRREPPPFVLQTALSDFYVEYQLNAYTEKPELRVPTLAALHANIQDVFNEYGVQIMSPHYEADPEDKKWVPRERWHEPPAAPAEPPAGSGAQRRES